MTHEVYPLLRHLFHDHSNMLRILNALRGEVARLRKSQASDHQLLKRIMEYLLTYPDLRHHPREDRIFQRLALRNPVAAAEAERLMVEHKELSEITRHLSAAFYHVQHDGPRQLDDFEKLAMKFIDQMRIHIHSEETNYFPAAVRSLSSADWSELENGRPDNIPPSELGDQIDVEYQALHDRIINQ